MTNHVDLDALVLEYGSHAKREDGVCLLEAVSWFADLKHSDHPACTDSVVASYARSLNDRMPHDQRQRLKAYIPRLAGTKNGASPVERAMVCADRAVRVFAVAALESTGRHKDAEKLRALVQVKDRKSALAAKRVAYAADAAANAAAYAADAAADAAAAAADDAANAAAYAADAAADPWADALQLLDDLIELGSMVSA